jgi:hypothetical protein
MDLVKRRAGSTPVYLFSVTGRQPYDEAIRDICRSAGIRFIDRIPRELAERERERPRSTKAADGEHLNETGNRVVAEGLLRFFETEGVLDAAGGRGRQQ